MTMDLLQELAVPLLIVLRLFAVAASVVVSFFKIVQAELDFGLLVREQHFL